MDSSDERALALRARQGDREAFGDLVRSHQAAVFNVAYRLLGEARDAEDTTQESFIRAFRYFPQYDLERPLGPWLKKIAVNICLRRLARGGPEMELPDEEGSLAGTEPLPEAQSTARERDRRVRSEILRLPPRYRAVIELRHFEELSYDEIADALDLPLSDIKSDLFRARRLLAERLKDLKA